MSEWSFLLERGLKGEALVREWLKLRGAYVLPISLIANGGAPALKSSIDRIIAMDTLVSRGGMSFWAEIKTYQRATFNQKRQRWEHGVTQRLWREYLEGQRLTGLEGYLFVLQLDNRLILEGALDDIAIGCVFTVGNHHPPSGPQVFFDIRRFKWYSLDSLDELDDDLFPVDLPPKTIRPWEQGRQMPKSRQLPLDQRS